MEVASKLHYVAGIGPALESKFKVIGLETVDDLLHNWPRRYDDYSEVTPIAQLRPGQVTISGSIKQATGRYVRRGMHITEAIISDATDSTRLIWFNQPYRANALRQDQTYYVSGTYELSHRRFAIINPSVELKSDFPINTARIIPIYKETKGLTSRQIRATLGNALKSLSALPDTLPEWLVKQEKLLPYDTALRTMHFPASSQLLAEARERLGFEEVFQLSLASLLNKQENQHEQAVSISFKQTLAKQFVAALPFTLTDAQRTTIWQIYLDIQKQQPMNRLVEGDVGSGKTVVATMAGLMAMAQGFQVAFMAPTELLARQHASTVFKLLDASNMSSKVVLLVGSMTAAQKRTAHQAIASGQAQMIIGTQALIQDSVAMHNLAMIVIDEQHRFGVEQRKTLMAKAGHMPHVLSLTATPIPRSLALTLYGELDISVLGSKPSGRQPIQTEIVSPNSKAQLFKTLEAELTSGRQMFVVCPVITDSTVLDVQSAESIYDVFRKKDFKQWRIGLLHGKLKPAEKTAVMARFVAGELDILVTTTVIEVGVDVPNASVMLIESPERFGLAQLHQLRGRVGRGSEQGYCYLLMSDSQSPSRRLRALESSSDGFRLSELDLELRGPGAIYGTLQHGALDLRIAKLSDTALISRARHAAAQFIEQGDNLLHYTQLAARVQQLRAVTNLN